MLNPYKIIASVLWIYTNFFMRTSQSTKWEALVYACSKIKLAIPLKSAHTKNNCDKQYLTYFCRIKFTSLVYYFINVISSGPAHAALLQPKSFYVLAEGFTAINGALYATVVV